jgi:arginine N-succinyltransferase
MPKHPVYIAMLTEAARAAIGLPHPSGRAAMRMLENEGFAWESYIDIFDGGPTMTARTDHVRTIREARDSTIVQVRDVGTEKVLAARGKLGEFVAAYAHIEPAEGGIAIDEVGAVLLGVGVGDTISHIARW